MCYLFKSIYNIFSMYFYFAYQISSTNDAWYIYTSSYDEMTKKLLVSSYELLIIWQASTIDLILQCRKQNSNTLLF